VRRFVVTGIILGIGLIALFVFYNKSKPVTPVLEKIEDVSPLHTVIGTSVEGRNIDAYKYGNGKNYLLIIGGIHGGYEWNSVVLAYKFLDYLNASSTVLSENLTVTVIPSLNPDGVYKVIGKVGRFESTDVPSGVATALGRFNAHEVDLNRNFDCRWKPESMWRDKVVSAGTKPFSEPEAVALRDFVLTNKPDAVVFWHSQANAVYASECGKGILPETLNILDVYSRASGYPAVKSFDAYETSGDSEGWLASIGIPTISVELKSHETVEWEQNLAGTKALIDMLGKK